MYYLLSGIDLLRIPDNVITSIDKACPGISPAMADIVTKAVGKDGRSGYSDVRDVKNDLLEHTKPLPLRAFGFYQEFVGDKLDNARTTWHTFHCNDARTGCSGFSPRPPVHMKWKCRLKPSQRYFLIAGGDYVYALSRDGMFYAVDHKTGEIVWKFLFAKP